MLYVSINQLELHGKHGAYPEEQILGNTFILDIKVGSQDEASFIDYGEILTIVLEVFAVREDYLESLILKMEKVLIARIEGIDALYISIKKLHPPLAAVMTSSEVSLEKKY